MNDDELDDLDEPNGCESFDDDELWEEDLECPYCHGTGFMGSEGIQADCPECGGAGWY